MHSTSTVFPVGSKLDRCVPWITGTGSSRSMGIKLKYLRHYLHIFSIKKNSQQFFARNVFV